MCETLVDQKLGANGIDPRCLNSLGIEPIATARLHGQQRFHLCGGQTGLPAPNDHIHELA